MKTPRQMLDAGPWHSLQCSFLNDGLLCQLGIVSFSTVRHEWMSARIYRYSDTMQSIGAFCLFYFCELMHIHCRAKKLHHFIFAINLSKYITVK